MSTNDKKGWRNVLKVHPACEAFPSISDEELKALAADIKQNGLQQKIVLWRDENTSGESLLDGRSRLDAMEMAGLPIFEMETLEMPTSMGNKLRVPCEVRASHRLKGFPNDVKRPPDETPESFVLSANLHRRHLTAEQRREVIAARLQANPEMSNRQIAAEVKVDHKTVAPVRGGLEGRGEIPHVATHTDSKGRKQPASKPGMLTKHRKAAAKEAERLKRGKAAYERAVQEIAAKEAEDAKQEPEEAPPPVLERMVDPEAAMAARVDAIRTAYPLTEEDLAFVGKLRKWVDSLDPPSGDTMPAPEAMAQAEETFRRVLAVIQEPLAEDLCHALAICGPTAIDIIGRVYFERYGNAKEAPTSTEAKPLH
jgi:hypothetical protein